jgi:hypothetical protein
VIYRPIGHVVRLAGHLPRMGETSNAYKILTVKPLGKRAIGRAKTRREDTLR